MDINTYNNFVSDILLETLVDIFSDNISCQMKRKLPLDLNRNKNAFVYDAVKRLFGIYMMSFNLKLLRKKSEMITAQHVVLGNIDCIFKYSMK